MLKAFMDRASARWQVERDSRRLRETIWRSFMFDIIRKAEYFECLREGFAERHDHSLKGIQDGWVMARLAGEKGKRILEVGGGNSRVLPKLAGNRLWNAEKFEGVGNGPTTANTLEGVTVIPTFMGEFSPEVPEVDIVFSISVIEHIPFEKYHDVFADMARVLAPGGTMYHAVDLPLGDEPTEVARRRVSLLRSAVEEAGLKWREAPSIGPDCIFTCDMASNSDLTAWGWSKISEPFRISGPRIQLVTIKIIADKS